MMLSCSVFFYDRGIANSYSRSANLLGNGAARQIEQKHHAS